MAQSTSNNHAEKKAAMGMIGAISAFKRYDPEAAIMMEVFLRVAAKPGIRMKELEAATKLSSSAIHRNVAVLSDADYQRDASGKRRQGLDLVVQVTDPLDSRVKQVTLTTLGRRLFKQMVSALDETLKEEA
jgi:DNA-binding MarR family transcriptional regulator